MESICLLHLSEICRQKRWFAFYSEINFVNLCRISTSRSERQPRNSWAMHTQPSFGTQIHIAWKQPLLAELALLIVNDFLNAFFSCHFISDLRNIVYAFLLRVSAVELVVVQTLLMTILDGWKQSLRALWNLMLLRLLLCVLQKPSRHQRFHHLALASFLGLLLVPEGILLFI